MSKPQSRKRVPTRAPRGVERHMDVEAMHALYDNAGRDLGNATATERLIMAGDLAKVTLRAIREGKPGRVFGWDYGREDLERQLAGSLERYVAAGRRQVAQELARQEAERRGRQLAERPKPKAAATLAAAAAAAAVAGTLAATVKGGMVSRAARAVERAVLRGIEPEEAELAADIAAASADELLRVRFAVHDLVAVGRSEEAKANGDRIVNCVQSALLDGGTCDACMEQDGRETTDVAEAETWTPVPDCEGGSRCRCCVVFELAP